MTQENSQDPMLDVPSGEIVSQDDIIESPGEGNSLLKALGGGDVDDEFLEEDANVKTGRKFSTQTAIIAGIAVLGGGMIYAMRRYEMQQGMVMKWIDTGPINAGTTFVTQLTPDQERVLSTLRTSIEPVKAPGNIDKNPFEMDEQGEPRVADNTDTNPKGPNIASLRAEFQRRFDALRISSVAAGKVPIAVINGDVYKVGGVVDGIFSITEIAKDESTYQMFVRFELVGFNPAVDGAEMSLTVTKGG